jgi:isoleucyl-tRNA synthetase
VGKNVLGEGNTAVIEALLTSGSLLKEEAYPHKYPYDWRTKKPTIFRATAQVRLAASASEKRARVELHRGLTRPQLSPSTSRPWLLGL